jgi:hypothetical protein
MVHGLTEDGQQTTTVYGGAQDEASAVNIAISQSARWGRPMGVYLSSDGTGRAFVGQFPQAQA